MQLISAVPYADSMASECEPSVYAERLAYLKCPQRIKIYTEREYGPGSITMAQCEAIVINAKRKASKSADIDRSHSRYNPDNDTGEPWRVQPVGEIAKAQQQRQSYTFNINDIRARSWSEAQEKRTELAGAPGRYLVWWVGQLMGLEPEEITGKSRKTKVVAARAVVARVLREKNPALYSYPSIGRILGNRDHSTIINLLQKWEERARRLPAMQKAYEKIVNAEQTP